MSQFIFIATYTSSVSVYVCVWKSLQISRSMWDDSIKATAEGEQRVAQKIEAEFSNILSSTACMTMALGWIAKKDVRERKFIGTKRIKILSQLKIGISSRNWVRLANVEWLGDKVNPNILLWVYFRCQKTLFFLACVSLWCEWHWNGVEKNLEGFCFQWVNKNLICFKITFEI